MRVAYVRVSTVDQNTDRQSIPDVERTFTDRASGKDTDRPALADLIAFVREGDTVCVWSIDRLARSLKDLQDLIARFNAKGVTVEFMSEHLTFSADKDDPFARLQFQMMGAFAEFERALIKERTLAGLSAARARGRKGGRPKKLSETQWKAIRTLLDAKELTVSEIAAQFGVSRGTIYRPPIDN